MKLMVFFLLVLCTYTFADVSAQKVSLDVKNVTFQEVVFSIQKQTGYSFVINKRYLDRSRAVTMQLDQADIAYALKVLFDGQPFTYSLDGKVVTLLERPKTATREPTIELADPAVQQQSVRGRVINEKGEPLVGASVYVLDAQGKRTAVQTKTDEQGYFELGQVQEGAKLEVGYLGRTAQRLTARTDMGSVVLHAITSALDETLVIAYGTTTKRLSTGSIGTLKATDIEKQPVSNPLATLQGRIAGLDVSATNGAPGSAMKVRIRGTNSLTNGSDPLFIIDGVPFAPGNANINQMSSIASRSTPVNYANTTQTSINFGNTFITSGLSPFQLINPADIESIEVLKDADATAIYGSRGANGVVLITTKKGNVGKNQFNVQIYRGASQVTRLWKMMNTREYVEMRKEAYKNDNQEPTLTNAYDLLVWDTTAYTDWQRLLIGGTAHTTDANLRLSGGSELMQYTIGGGFRREGNVFPGDHTNTRGSLQTQVRTMSKNQRFKTEFGMNYTVNKNESVGSISGIDLPPNAPGPYDENGKLSWGPKGAEFTNPLATLMNSVDIDMENIMANLLLSYRLMEGFHLKTSIGHNSIHTSERSISPVASKNPHYTATGSFGLSNGHLKSWILEPQLEYNVSHDDMNWTALAGATWQYNNNVISSISGSGYTDDTFINAMQAAAGVTSTNGETRYKYAAVFGRLSWQWKARYLMNISARRDGSSRFGAGRRFNNFGAIGAGWIFSEEPSFDALSSILSFGKIRGSYGITGSDQIGDYMYLNTWSLTSSRGDGLKGLIPDALFNDEFNWERNRKGELGIELGFLNDRILLTTNGYINRSSNQLVLYKLGGQTGFGGVMQNFPALIQNSGLEFEINAKPFVGTFRWMTSANLSLPKNKLMSFPDLDNSSYKSAFVIGESVNLLKGYLFDGVNSETGVYVLKDIDGDGKYNSADQVVLGNRDPSFFGGWNNSFSYKGFDLDVFMEFKKIFGYTYYYASAYAGTLQNRLAVMTNRWRQPGDTDVIFQRYTANSGAAYTAAASLQSSNLAYGDNSYVRLKSLMLAYNFTIGKSQQTKCRVFAQGYNLWTWNRNRDMDPEAPINSIGIPPLRTLTLGLNVNL